MQTVGSTSFEWGGRSQIYYENIMMPQLEKSQLSGRYPGLVMAQSTRYGGVSQGAYESLNLGLHTDDEQDIVLENRKRFWDVLGTQEGSTAGGYQVHGSEIKKVVQPGYFDGFDAFVTDLPDLFLTVTVADCVPVLIYDPVKKVIGAIHAGWRGTARQITAKTVTLLEQEYGTRPSDCIAYIGTCIGYDSFEVSQEVAMEFSSELRAKTEVEGKYRVDLKAANLKQLMRVGLTRESVEVSPYCTMQDHHRFFSHRKEGGITGRMLAVVAMRSVL